MADRFERLFELPRNLYTEGSPVIISAGVLLKDTQSGNVIAQIKFQSVAEKTIKALKLSLAAYDVTGKALQCVPDYHYLELNVTVGEDFGSNKAIVMPVTVTRSFNVESVTVIFEDGVIWETAEPFEALPQSQLLNFGNAEIEKQYRIATNANAKYTPCTDKDLWQCSCGSWNRSSNCSHCYITKDIVFGRFNLSVLTEQANARIASDEVKKEIAAEREIIRKQEEEAKHAVLVKKLQFITVVALTLVAVLLVLSLWIWPKIVRPYIAYQEAMDLLQQKEYAEAISAFEAISGHKDSQNMICEAKYALAKEFLSDEEYASALELFSEIRYFRDSDQYLANFGFIKQSYESYFPDHGTYKEIFNEKGLLISKITRSGKVSTFDYDHQDRLLYEKGDGYITEYKYDAAGNLLVEKTNGESSSIIEYAYDQNGRVVSKKNSKFEIVMGYEFKETWRVTFYEYDIQGYVLREYEWLDSSYDSLKRSLIEYGYDEQGNCISQITYAFEGDIVMDDVVDAVFLDNNTMLKIQAIAITPKGHVVYRYENGLLLEEQHDGVVYFTYTYENGRLIIAEDHKYNVIDNYLYDEWGNLIAIEGSDGDSEKYTYIPVFMGGYP